VWNIAVCMIVIRILILSVCSDFCVVVTTLNLGAGILGPTEETLITFCNSHSQAKFILATAVWGSVPRHIPTLLHMHPDVTLGNGRGCPLVVHYWADLQLVHGLRCYVNICT